MAGRITANYLFLLTLLKEKQSIEMRYDGQEKLCLFGFVMILSYHKLTRYKALTTGLRDNLSNTGNVKAKQCNAVVIPVRKLRWASRIWLICRVQTCRTPGWEECRRKASMLPFGILEVMVNLHGSPSALSSRPKQLTCAQT